MLKYIIKNKILNSQLLFRSLLEHNQTTNKGEAVKLAV